MAARSATIQQLECVGWGGAAEAVLCVMPRSVQQLIVFFHGDIQRPAHTTEVACGKFDHLPNLDVTTVVQTLHDACDGQAGVLAVLASRYEEDFACFDRFVNTDKLGAAKCYNGAGHAGRHLQALVHDAARQLDVDLGVPWHVVGFSHGAVVLNQLVTELDSVPEAAEREGELAEERSTWADRLAAMYWLDGGHSRKDNLYASCGLAALARRGTTVVMRSTPFQLSQRHKRLAKEAFVAACHAAGVEVDDSTLFPAAPPSMLTHFGLLDAAEVRSWLRVGSGRGED